MIGVGIDKYTPKGRNDGYANEEYANEMRNDGFGKLERRDASPEGRGDGVPEKDKEFMKHFVLNKSVVNLPVPTQNRDK